MIVVARGAKIDRKAADSQRSAVVGVEIAVEVVMLCRDAFDGLWAGSLLSVGRRNTFLALLVVVCSAINILLVMFGDRGTEGWGVLKEHVADHVIDELVTVDGGMVFAARATCVGGGGITFNAIDGMKDCAVVVVGIFAGRAGVTWRWVVETSMDERSGGRTIVWLRNAGCGQA